MYDKEALREIRDAQTLDVLRRVEVKWLGRNGIITRELREYGQQQKEAREMERQLEEIDKSIKEAWNKRHLELTGEPGTWE